MATVACAAHKCVHYNNGWCGAKHITIDCDLDCYCDTYEDYTKTGDYKQEYWQSCKKISTGEPYKTKGYGKLIQIQDMEFYTSEDDRAPSLCGLTEKQTGCYAGVLAYVEENIDSIRIRCDEMLKEHGRVTDLPEEEERK